MTDTIDTALLPCPFCGGPVKLEKAHIQHHRELGARQFYGVVCRNTTNLGGTCCMEQVPSASKDAAIARWNTRAQLAAQEQGKFDCSICGGVVDLSEAKKPDQFSHQGRQKQAAQDEWPTSVMQQWDYWRKQIASGDKTSAPRDWFESLCDRPALPAEPLSEIKSIAENQEFELGDRLQRIIAVITMKYGVK